VSLSKSVDISSKNLLARQITTMLRFSGLDFSSEEIKKSIILIKSKDPVNVAEAVSRIPGVDYTAIVESVSSNYEDVVNSIVKAGVKLIYPGETFNVKVNVKSSLPYLSRDIEFATCAKIVGELGEKNVRLDKKNPSKTIYAEVEDEIAYIFYYKYDGPGGVPVGSKGKALCVLFGDNNSAVSSWLMIRQGIFPHFLFFDAIPYFDHSNVKRIITIATLLREFLPVRRYSITALRIGSIIKKLRQVCSSEILPYVLNRMTMRITSAYANKIGVSIIAIGESLEKSNLQTIKDLIEISSNYNKQILFPLIGLNEKEIINYSKKIGIFKFAKEKKLEMGSTKIDRKAIIMVESKLEIDKLVEEVLSKAILINLDKGFDDIHNILNNYFSQKLES